MRRTKRPRTTDELKEYRRKRDFSASPEPAPGRANAAGGRFVVQEHSATRLHWDLRLERDGVAVSWAVPNGIPEMPGENRMAVHTEDHPLEYLSWEGVIPKGNYGAGTMKVWDKGTYETHEWTDAKATVTFHGEELSGRYHLFHIGGRSGNDWMIRRVDPPLDPDREPMPEHIAPLAAMPGPLPDDDEHYAFEIQWDGVRGLAFCAPGRLRIEDAAGGDITAFYPEIARLTRSIGARTAVLDGELVALGDDGRPDRSRLERRAKPGSESAMRRRARDIPVIYEIYDLVFLDGHSLMHLPWHERHKRLRSLELDGENWRTSQHHEGDGAALLEAARANDLPGIIAKPLDSRYAPGAGWIAIAAAGEPPHFELKHPERVIYPKAGVTKADVADYYRAVAPVLLPHVIGRSPIDSLDALMRWVDKDNIELDVTLAPTEDSDHPTQMVFDLDGSEPDRIDAALLLRGMLEQLGIESLARTSGSSGLQVCVPLNSDVTFEQADAFARQVAELIVERSGKVRIDSTKSAIAPYSLRAGDRPAVSTPVTWEEVAAGELDFDYAAVVERIHARGDLFAPALSLVQTLPL